MKYNFNGKTVNIPDEEIKKSMTALDISKEEAIDMWLSDNDYTSNEEVEELSKKAKNVKRYEKSDSARKKTTKERKVDPDKKYLIELLHAAVANECVVTSTKNEAEFSFEFGENDYTVKLIKHRKKN